MSEDLTGRTLGPYEIVDELGQGGMATVYRAFQPSMERHVAIKVLPRAFAHDPTFVGRFQQEAKVIARLEHARILPVYDYGEQDGITYIVMRYLNAGTLSEYMDQGPIPLDDVSRIISQIAEGLDYAHKRGVFHRDIKPSNVLLDESGDAYITDFGIARLAESSGQFTGSGIVGTPTYISPEQAMGHPVDGRTDIYSLGVVLYQMVTGDVPFQAETPMGVVIKHINDPLPSPRTLLPSIPANVEAVIMQSLAKTPEARYQTAGDLAKALRTAVLHPTEPAPADTPAPVSGTVPSLAHIESQTMPIAAAPAAAPAPAAAAIPVSASSPSMSGTLTATAQPRASRGCMIAASVWGGLVVLCLVVAIVVLIQANVLGRADSTLTPEATSPLVVAESTSSVLETPSGGGAAEPTSEEPAEASEEAPVGAVDEGTATAPAFETSFDERALPPALTWLREPGEGHWALEEGRLRFDVLAATARGSANTPALMIDIPPRANAYTTEASVHIDPSPNTGAGIALVSRADQVIVTLVYGVRPSEAGDVEGVFFDQWEMATQEDYHAHLSGAGFLVNDVMLRLVVVPGEARGFYSYDAGVTWERAGSWPIAEVRIDQVAMITGGGADIETISAYFDDFRVFAGALVP